MKKCEPLIAPELNTKQEVMCFMISFDHWNKYFPCIISLSHSLNHRTLKIKVQLFTSEHTHILTHNPFKVLLNTTTAEPLSDNSVNAGWAVWRWSTVPVLELLYVYVYLWDCVIAGLSYFAGLWPAGCTGLESAAWMFCRAVCRQKKGW